MASQSPQLDSALKSFKAYFENPSAEQTKLSLSKKRELLEIIALEISKLAKRNLMAYQPQIVQIILSLSSFGCGASLLRCMLSILSYLYTQGDFTKMQSEFFEPSIPLIAGSDKKASNSHQKMNLCFLTSKVFKALWPRCHTPPTKELLEGYFKLAKGSQEKQIKEAAYRAIKTVVKANPSNFFQISQDIFKLIQKQIGSTDKEVVVVKGPIVACLRAFVQATLNISSLHQLFEQLLAQSIKALEDTSPDVTEEYTRIIFHLFNQRLSESQQQGDMKTGFRAYNHQQREAQQAQGKKLASKTTYLDIPRTLSDIFSFISAILLKIQGNNATLLAQQTSSNMRLALTQVLIRLIYKNPVHLDAQDPESLLTPLLLSCNFMAQTPQAKGGVPIVDQEIAIKTREACAEILSKVVAQYQNGEKAAQVIKQALQCLQQRQVVGMQKDTLETFSGFCKNQKVSSMLNESQTLLLIRLVTDILYINDHNFLIENFITEKEVIDPLIPYIKDASLQVRLFAIELLKTLGFRAKPWTHALLTLFLSLSTMTNADLTSLRQVPYHVHLTQGVLSARPGTAEATLCDLQSTLNSQAVALSCLLAGVSHSLNGGGVPLTLTNTVFNSAKSMILGSWKIEDEEDEAALMTLYQGDMSKNDSQESQRREAGWIIMEGLIHLGNQWIGTRLSMIFKLLNSVFSKEMCTVTPSLLRDPNYMERVLYEFRIKKAALSTLRYFLVKASTLLNSQLWKVVNTFLVNAVTFFINHDKDKKEVIQAFKVHLSEEEYRQAKADLFECFLQLPSNNLYVSKYVHILHSVCEELVSDSTPPHLPLNLLHPDDQLLSTPTPSPTPTTLPPLSLLPRLDHPLSQHTSSADPLLSPSMQLFADLFASHSLNIKNKQQLIKHLVVHTTTQSVTTTTAVGGNGGKKGNPTVEVKVGKVLSIAMTMVGVVKAAIKQGVPVDQEIQTQIHLLLKNCEVNLQQHSDALVMLTKIQAEVTVLMRAATIHKDQLNSIEAIVKEQETSIQQIVASGAEGWNKKAKAIAVLGNLVRYYDFDTILKPFADRILKLMQILVKDNHTFVREFYLHHCAQMTKRLSTENLYPRFFATLFQTCFHQMQTDIKTNESVLASLGKMLCYQIKADPDSITGGNARAILTLREFIDIIFLRKGDDAALMEAPTSFNAEVMSAASELIKSSLINDFDLLAGRQEKILIRTISLLKINCTDKVSISLRIKLVELLGAFTYKGYLPLMQKLISPKSESYSGVFSFILDLLNTSMAWLPGCLGADGKYLKRMGFDGVKKTFTMNEEFEKLINYREQHYLNNERALAQFTQTEREVAQQVMLQQALRTLYCMMLKLAMGSSKGIGEWIEYAKAVNQYKHTSPLQVYEEQKKKAGEADGGSSPQVRFTYDLKDQVRYFAVKTFKTFVQLYGTVDSSQNSMDLRRNLGSLVSLGFSIISNDSQLLKKAGFSLIIVIVKLFKRLIEKIGDEEDEDELNEDANKKRVREYLENPLLLEQYEAQLFSIIRQHISIELHDPTVILKNYKLIYYFITAPICKDQTTIGKVFTMLTDNIISPNGHSTLFNQCDMMHYEKVISELHFKKLILLSKIIMRAMGTESRDLRFIETNTKKMNASKILAGTQDDNLPSKFQKEDRERIMELISYDVAKALISHSMLALQDCMLLTSLPKQSLKSSLRDLTFIRGTSRSAYNHETIEKAMQYLVKFVTFTSDLEKRVKRPLDLSDDHQMILHTLLTTALGSQIKKQEGESPQENSPHQLESLALYNHVQLKIQNVRSLNKLLGDKNLKLRDDAEFDLYITLLLSLSTFGLLELTTQVLLSFQHLLRTHSPPPHLSEALHSHLFTLASSSLLSVLTRGGSEPLGQEALKLVGVCFESLQMVSETEGPLRGQAVAVVLIRIAGMVEAVKSGEDGVKAISAGVQAMIQKVRRDQSMQEIVWEAIEQLVVKLGEQTEVTKGTQYQVAIVFKMIEAHQDTVNLNEILNNHIFNRDKMTICPQMTLFILKMISASLSLFTPSALYPLTFALLTFAYELLAPTQAATGPLPDLDLALLQDTIPILLAVYQALPVHGTTPSIAADTPPRKLTLLHQLLLTLFTVIQAKLALPPALRNSQIASIVQLFQADAQLFKALMQGTQACALTVPEKALIEKVLREVSNTTTTTNHMQAAGKASGQGEAGKAATGQEHGGKPAGGSIQLAMSFGSKKK